MMMQGDPGLQVPEYEVRVQSHYHDNEMQTMGFRSSGDFLWSTKLKAPNSGEKRQMMDLHTSEQERLNRGTGDQGLICQSRF